MQAPGDSQKSIPDGFGQSGPDGILGFGQLGDGFVEGGLAGGVGGKRFGAAFLFLHLAERGGRLVGKLGQGEFAAVEPDKGTLDADIHVQRESGHGEGPLGHGGVATGTTDGGRGVAGKTCLRFGFQFDDGFPRDAPKGVVAGEFKQMALALRTAQDGEAFVGGRRQGHGADRAGAGSHG